MNRKCFLSYLVRSKKPIRNTYRIDRYLLIISLLEKAAEEIKIREDKRYFEMLKAAA